MRPSKDVADTDASSMHFVQQACIAWREGGQVYLSKMRRYTHLEMRKVQKILQRLQMHELQLSRSVTSDLLWGY